MTPSGPALAVVVPAAPGLLPCQGLTDPFAPVRDAVLATLVPALAEVDEVELLVTGPTEADLRHGVRRSWSERVGHALLDRAGWTGARRDCPVSQTPSTTGLLLVPADGSARRGEKAPGHLDERAFELDDRITKALGDGDGAALAGLDQRLAAELLAAGAPALAALARAMPAPTTAELLYADDPFGVAYWVARWTAR